MAVEYLMHIFTQLMLDISFRKRNGFLQPLLTSKFNFYKELVDKRRQPL